MMLVWRICFLSHHLREKIHLQKKRLESKLCRKYVLNLLNEPQHLSKIRTLTLLKFPSKGVTNLCK